MKRRWCPGSGELRPADLLDAASDAVAVKRAHGGEGLEDHEVQGALEEIELESGMVLNAPV